MRTEKVTASLLLCLAACTASGPPPAASTTQATDGVACADVVLRVGSAGAPGQFAVGANRLPSIGVNVDAVVADQTTVTLAPCANPTDARTHLVPGGLSFVLDQTWYAQAAPEGCFRVTATATLADEIVAQASAVVRRGDCEVVGTIFAPPTRPDRPALVLPRANVEVLIDDTWMQTRADEHGRYKLAHVPAGKLHLVRAKSSPEDTLRLTGEAAPFLVLEPSHAVGRVDLTLAPPAPVVDAFEPDDTVEDARAPRRPIIAHELHNLPAREDVDLIAVDLAAGQVLEVRATPQAGHAADLALAVLAADGQTVLAHANDGADFVPAPSLRIAAPAGLVFVRVTRLDDAAEDAPYDLSITR